MSTYFQTFHPKTDKIYHEVELIDGSKRVKQHPNRMNPVKQHILRDEVQYLLENDFIEPSQSEWSSPCILIPKIASKYDQEISQSQTADNPVAP